MLRKLPLIATATFALAALAACGDDSTGGTSTPDTVIGGDTTESDTTAPADTTETPAVRRLEFVQDFGDDQVACRGTDRCTISLSYTERRTLEVSYTEDGAATAGQVVKFNLEVDNDGVGFLNTLSSVTDDAGVAAVETKPKEARVGQFTVKAWIDDDAVPPLYFDVVVTPKGQVPLTVIGTYDGTRPVGNYNVRLYKQDASAKPDCSDLLDLQENQTAAQARDNIQLTQSAKFPELDGLESDGTQTYTVLVFSENQFDAIQAWGCNDADAVVTWESAKTVQIEMVDRPPLYAGVYEIVSRFDFVSAIPEPYKTYVDYVVGFFQSPTNTVIDLACNLLADDAGNLNEFCGYLFDDDGNPTSLFGFASDLIDGIIESLAEDSVFGTIFTVGGDVADILKAFEIRGTLTFDVEPDADGKWYEGDTADEWTTVTVKWSLGANCDPETDENCGVDQFSTSVFQQGDAVSGTFGASVADYFDLTIDKHPLNLKYGALINYFLEKYLISVVLGEPTVDTYEELLGYLVGGGTECLTPSVDGLSCCQTFADGVGDEDGEVNGATETAIEAACTTISGAGPAYLRDTLAGLDLESGETFNIGTLEPCTLSDFDGDMMVDGVGSQAAPCKWDVTLKFSEASETTFDAIFWGARQE